MNAALLRAALDRSLASARSITGLHAYTWVYARVWARRKSNSRHRTGQMGRTKHWSRGGWRFRSMFWCRSGSVWASKSNSKEGGR
jgi:hypothetical protein